MGKNLRPADVAAHYGGEEFAVLMPNSAHDAGLHVAERLREAICRLCLTHGAPAAGALVTLSTGVATEVPIDEMNSDLQEAKADQALYAAKHSGRDRVLSSESALLTFADKETAARWVERKVRARETGRLQILPLDRLFGVVKQRRFALDLSMGKIPVIWDDASIPWGTGSPSTRNQSCEEFPRPASDLQPPGCHRVDRDGLPRRWLRRRNRAVCSTLWPT